MLVEGWVTVDLGQNRESFQCQLLLPTADNTMQSILQLHTRLENWIGEYSSLFKRDNWGWFHLDSIHIKESQPSRLRGVEWSWGNLSWPYCLTYIVQLKYIVRLKGFEYFVRLLELRKGTDLPSKKKAFQRWRPYLKEGSHRAAAWAKVLIRGELLHLLSRGWEMNWCPHTWQTWWTSGNFSVFYFSSIWAYPLSAVFLTYYIWRFPHLDLHLSCRGVVFFGIEIGFLGIILLLQSELIKNSVWLK